MFRAFVGVIHNLLRTGATFPARAEMFSFLCEGNANKLVRDLWSEVGGWGTEEEGWKKGLLFFSWAWTKLCTEEEEYNRIKMRFVINLFITVNCNGSLKSKRERIYLLILHWTLFKLERIMRSLFWREIMDQPLDRPKFKTKNEGKYFVFDTHLQYDKANIVQ